MVPLSDPDRKSGKGEVVPDPSRGDAPGEAAGERGDGVSPDEGLTPEERRMLDSLSGGGAVPEPVPEPGPVPSLGTGAPVAGTRTSTALASPPGQTGLTAQEEQVLGRVRDESERVEREELPGMFEKPAKAEEVPRVVPAQPAAASVAEPSRRNRDEAAAVTPPVEKNALLRILAVPFDLINRPFRWMGPVWRMGLGLCGVLLLITLLLVVLVRILLGE